MRVEQKDVGVTEPILFYDTCVQIGNARAPDLSGPPATVPELLDRMAVHQIAHAAVGHAVAMEASPRLGHELLERELAGIDALRPAWHLMPDVSPRIERAVTDPNELISKQIALGRVTVGDFCNGRGDQACFAPVLEACAAVHLPLFLDFRGQGDFSTFDFRICDRYPAISFVIEGFGLYPLHRVVWALREYSNLYLSTMGLSVFNGVSFFCDEIGADRLVYGSGWPMKSMGTSQGPVLLSRIGLEERRAIASGNFLRLLDQIQEDV